MTAEAGSAVKSILDSRGEGIFTDDADTAPLGKLGRNLDIGDRELDLIGMGVLDADEPRVKSVVDVCRRSFGVERCCFGWGVGSVGVRCN